MNRSESLRLLHNWAEYGPAWPLHDQRHFAPDPTIATREHGLAAVRAVRAIRKVHACYCSPFTCYTFCTCPCHSTDAVSEARAAFRCALNAVGLRSL